ncbi:hypothetical protein [Thermococcus sp.]|uniref:hypothetical protein n=1 Tax=Thermococcus sp. TaxID=35749 RepID=UPI00262FFE49|nr:hypothetical protein [Thermococcus sp.]
MTAICDELRSLTIKNFCRRIITLARESGGYFEPIAQEFLDEYYKLVETPRIRGHSRKESTGRRETLFVIS